MNPRRPATLALAAALLALAGCASTGTGPSTPATTPATTSATTSATTPATTPVTTSATPGPAAVTVDEHADRTTVRIAVGATLTLALHSTYWSAATSSAPEVLAPDGAPSTAPSPSCRPGGGCGTVTAAFTARAAGTARLTATRTSCGEALNCPPEQRTYEVTVDVEG